jgi:hypothetical protein
MPLTRIQPSGIDQTLDYSVDQLTANTVVVSGVNILNSANAANNLAQAAFEKANTGGVSGTNNARSIINSYVFGY